MIECLKPHKSLLQEVSSWAAAQGITEQQIQSWHKDCFVTCVSRLLECLCKENLVKNKSYAQEGDEWYLKLFESKSPDAVEMLVPVEKPLIEWDVRAIGLPRQNTGTISAHAEFLFTLSHLVVGIASESFCLLTEDFENSLANLLLNRILFNQLDKKSPCLEPVYLGHHYYPFPGLRIGPSIEAISNCSPICRNGVELRYVSINPRDIEVRSIANKSLQDIFFRALGTQVESGILPVHPWQLEQSKIVKGLFSLEISRLSPIKSIVVPLASQRTCRVLQTGFDLKLSLDATLTGEHRLIYPLNRINAPVVSALISDARTRLGERSLEFQYDVASAMHRDSLLGNHLSVIFREPVLAEKDEMIISALNLWCLGKNSLAFKFLQCKPHEYIVQFFRQYAFLLLTGPIRMLLECGIALEPHLQNTLFCFKRGEPTRVIFRDLDSAIIDFDSVDLEFRKLFPALTWEKMPTRDVAECRLSHAIFIGHLDFVMKFLAKNHGIDYDQTLSIFWSIIEKLQQHYVKKQAESNYLESLKSIRPKKMLSMRLLKTMEQIF